MKPEELLPHIHALSQFMHGWVHHWLDFGSLLGAIREGALIEDIRDVDFGFQDNDQKARNWLNGHAQEIRKETGFILKDYGGYVLRLFWSEGIDLTSERAALDSSHASRTLFIDLFDCQRLGRTMLHGLPRHDFPAFFIDGTDTAKIGPYSFPVPRHAKTFLAHRYGPNWMTPLSKEEFEKVECELVVPFKTSYTAYVQGVFDLFHHGHASILKRAKNLFETVIAGVDPEENLVGLSWKTRPVLNLEERTRVVEACGYVDAIILPPAIATVASLDRVGADYLVCGLEAPERLSHLYQEVINADRCHTMERTPGISTTEIRQRLKSS